MDEQASDNPSDNQPVEEPTGDAQPSTSHGIMDIKPAAQEPPKPALPIEVAEEPAEEEPAVMAEEPETSHDQEAEVDETTPSSQPPTEEEPTEDKPKPAEESAPAEASKPNAVLPSRGSNAKLKIVLAVVIALILAAGTIYMYVSKNKKTSSGTNSQTSNGAAQTAKAAPASPSDVDTATQDVDASLTQADNAQDIVSTDLNDSTLGL